jgi:cell division protein FtsZ
MDNRLTPSGESDEASGRIRPAERADRARTSIKVIGIGGAGGNAISNMIEARTSGVEFMAVNTDLQALSSTLAPTRMQIGEELTKGMGAGSNPEIGRRSAEESHQELASQLAGTDMVFVTAGMGGGTGTGAAPVIARIATEMGCLTVGVITKPFEFEGKTRQTQAEEGGRALRHMTDALITIPNQRLLQVLDRGTALRDAFKVADNVLRQAVEGIASLIVVPGLINLDFADVRAVMGGVGLAAMGTGVGRGDGRALEAAHLAISSPLLEDSSIEGARGVLMNVTGGNDMGLHEVHDAASVIREAVHEDADVIFGAVSDETLEDELRVTVIATGLHHWQADSQGLPREQSAEDPYGSGAHPERGGRQRPRDASGPADAKGALSDIPAYVRRRFR